RGRRALCGSRPAASVDSMNDTVLPFPTPDEERARRLKVEVERLARLPVSEQALYIEGMPGYAEKYGTDKATLRRMGDAVVKDIEKKACEARGELRRREDRAEKKAERRERDADRRDERRARDDERRAERRAREDARLEREARKEAEKAEAKRVK